MNANISRSQSLELLKKYNSEPFHILHGLTVEGVMRWFAQEQGFGDDADFWGLCGITFCQLLLLLSFLMISCILDDDA